MVDSPQVEIQDLEAKEREERRRKIRAAREREERLVDLDSIFVIYNQIHEKTDKALTSLKEILSLAISLNQKLSSGSYREVNMARRLKVQLMMQTTSAAINQLARVSKISKLVAPIVKEEATRQIESPPAFE